MDRVIMATAYRRKFAPGCFNRLAEAQGESERAFGSNEVFLERLVKRAKHIEVQVLGDKHGHVLHLHDRDRAAQSLHDSLADG